MCRLPVKARRFIPSLPWTRALCDSMFPLRSQNRSDILNGKARRTRSSSLSVVVNCPGKAASSRERRSLRVIDFPGLSPEMGTFGQAIPAMPVSMGLNLASPSSRKRYGIVWGFNLKSSSTSRDEWIAWRGGRGKCPNVSIQFAGVYCS